MTVHWFDIVEEWNILNNLHSYVGYSYVPVLAINVVVWINVS